MRPVLAKLADTLGAVGLGDPAFRLFQRLQAWAGGPSAGTDSAAALPPAYLRVLTSGSPDARAFVEVGRGAAIQFIELAERFGPPLQPATRVLDFGCGCGRVAAQFLERRPVQLHGCDINQGLVDWCAGHLPATFDLTRPEPPLPYADGAFDLVYALSVFTHLQDRTARTWLGELARVTRPGGLALLSFWDEHAPAAARFQQELEIDGFFLKRSGAEGSNLLTGFFSHDGLAERSAPWWRRLHSVPSPEAAAGQAIMVLQRAGD